MSIIGDGIRTVLDYGIDLKLESKEEEAYYIVKMCEYFNEESEFRSYLSGDSSFEIELDRSSPVMEVCIQDSYLTIIPYTEDIFEAFTMILSFIAKNHESLILEMRSEMPDKIEKPDNVNNEKEEDSDDDFEWI